MDTKRIVIVPKITSYDYTMTQFFLTGRQVINRWRGEGMSKEDIENTMRAHQNHYASFKILKNIFYEYQFVPRDEFNREHAQHATAVIALGGDDHLQYVSHFLEKTPLIGVNSDPVKKKGASDGNLMYFEAEDTSLLMKRLKKDEFEIQPWTRLSAKIVTGGGTIEATSATCQYSIVTEDPEDMARVLVEFKGNRELQRGTGILIATGAGTTGWYKGASKYVSPNRYRLSRMEREAKFVLREPFEKEDILPNEITKYKMHSLLLQEDEEIGRA